MADLGLVFHNLRDHLETALDVLGGKATGSARERLLTHMASEEEGNQRLLADALANAAPEERRAVQLALDHSRLFVDIVKGAEIAPDLGKSILSHLLEEHDQGLLMAPGAAPRSGWTVGSLLGEKKP